MRTSGSRKHNYNYEVPLIGHKKPKQALCHEIGLIRVGKEGRVYAGDAGNRHRKADVSLPVTPGVWRVIAVTDDAGLGPQNHALLMVHTRKEVNEKKLEPMTPVRRGIIKAVSGIAGLFLKPQSETCVATEETPQEVRSAMGAFGYLATRLAGIGAETSTGRSVLTMLPTEDGVTGSLFDGLPGTARVYTDVDTSKASANVVALVLDNRVALA